MFLEDQKLKVLAERRKIFETRLDIVLQESRLIARVFLLVKFTFINFFKFFPDETRGGGGGKRNESKKVKRKKKIETKRTVAVSISRRNFYSNEMARRVRRKKHRREQWLAIKKLRISREGSEVGGGGTCGLLRNRVILLRKKLPLVQAVHFEDFFSAG